MKYKCANGTIINNENLSVSADDAYAIYDALLRIMESYHQNMHNECTVDLDLITSRVYINRRSDDRFPFAYTPISVRIGDSYSRKWLVSYGCLSELVRRTPTWIS